MQDFLHELSQRASGRTLVMDNDGYFLDHPDKSKTFDSELGTQINYFAEQPKLKENLK